MMRRSGFIPPLLLLVILAVGCSSLNATPSPTTVQLGDVSTAVQQTLQAANPPVTQQGFSTVISPASPTGTSLAATGRTQGSPTPLVFNPSATLSPSPSPSSTPGITNTPSRRATHTPTITPTPPIPNAGVQFVEPGPMSKVVSPLHVIANLRSAPSGTYRVELWAEPLRPGEPPRLLYLDLERIISNPIDWVYIDQDVQFELARVSEFGQLRLSVYDEYDRPTTINSVDLILLSMGPSAITPSNIRSEPIVIREPTRNKLIQGGTLIASGLARPTEDFMLVELVATDGSIVGYRQVFVSPAADGSYVPWAVEVPYTVTSGTWVRLRVSETGTRIAGMEHLASVEVYLSP
jgi:hypothetical protein